jgi:hypothetical protein
VQEPHDIPDPSRILPYIGLYTLITLKPAELEFKITTSSFPCLSILTNGEWVPAPPHTLPTAPNVARIFDARAVPVGNHPESFGIIPLCATHPQFSQTRYFRLPKQSLGAVLSALLLRVILHPPVGEETRLAHGLYAVLAWRQLGFGDLAGTRLSGGGSGPSGGGSGLNGGGPLGRKTRQKRGAEKKSPDQPSKKQAPGAAPASQTGKSCSIS